MINDLWVNVEDLLDQIDNDDIMRYVYKQKCISPQVMKKYFDCDKIENIPDGKDLGCEYIDFDKLGLDEYDILDNMGDDDIYDYLDRKGYDFPQDDVDPEAAYGQEPPDWSHYDTINAIKEVLNRRFGKTWSKKELKKQFNEVVDWFSTDPEG